MAFPTLLALGDTLPDADIHLLAVSRIHPLFAGLDEPFRLLPQLPGSSRPLPFLESASRVRKGRYDAALLFPPSFSSAWMLALGRIPVRVGWDGEHRGFLLTGTTARPVRTRHLRDQYHELGTSFLAAIGSPRTLSEAPIRIPLRAEELLWARRWWTEQGLVPEQTIVLAPGATYGLTKRWSEDRFRGLAGRLRDQGWNLLWFGGEQERKLTESLTDDVRVDGPVSRSLAGQMTIRESLALLAGARAAISNDSGAMHLAQAAGCPVVAIFGSSAPPWTGPIGDSQRTLHLGLPCSPCFARNCPTQVECLTGISVEDVGAALTDLVAQTGPNNRRRPAVFLDRDGTLLEFVDYLDREEDVRLTRGAATAIDRLQKAGYAVVVVTNQSIVARGGLSRAQLRRIHRRMESLLAAEGILLDGIEFCPHHPEFTGRCACRKPEPGMLLRAAHRLDLDLGRSLMVGDSRSDLETARNAGIASVLVRTGYGREVEQILEKGSPMTGPAAVADHLAAAADWILKRSSPSHR